jgi:dsRNA-specific ribonuclease
MIYMLEKFSLEVVNERLMTIKDTEYRYLVVRKLLKKLRKDQEGKLTKARKNVTGSKVARSALHI